MIAFRKLDIEVLGLIENMSYFTDDSGKDHYIFGTGNIDNFSEKARRRIDFKLTNLT